MLGVRIVERSGAEVAAARAGVAIMILQFAGPDPIVQGVPAPAPRLGEALSEGARANVATRPGRPSRTMPLTDKKDRRQSCR